MELLDLVRRTKADGPLLLSDEKLPSVVSLMVGAPVAARCSMQPEGA